MGKGSHAVDRGQQDFINQIIRHLNKLKKEYYNSNNESPF